MSKISKEELLSRREFFKRGAKKTLPILACLTIPPVFYSCDKEEDIMGGCTDCSSGCNSTSATSSNNSSDNSSSNNNNNSFSLNASNIIGQWGKGYTIFVFSSDYKVKKTVSSSHVVHNYTTTWSIAKDSNNKDCVKTSWGNFYYYTTYIIGPDNIKYEKNGGSTTCLSCASSCQSICTGDCTSSCDRGNCKGNCSVACGSSCSGTCVGYCYQGCTGYSR